jgi:hypothetical protein
MGFLGIRRDVIYGCVRHFLLFAPCTRRRVGVRTASTEIVETVEWRGVSAAVEKRNASASELHGQKAIDFSSMSDFSRSRPTIVSMTTRFYASVTSVASFLGLCGVAAFEAALPMTSATRSSVCRGNRQND